jgi:hypothetical protein
MWEGGCVVGGYGVLLSKYVVDGCGRLTFISQAIFKIHPFRLSSNFSCSLIERACSLSMLAYCAGSAICCAQDSNEKRGTETFLPGRFDQGFMW